MGLVEERTRGVKEERLTDKMLRFAHEYMLDGNGKRAAIEAGYSKKSAHVMAAKLLKHPLVKQFIGKQHREDRNHFKLTRRRIIQELAYAALRDPLDLCDENGQIIVQDLRQVPEHMRRCIDGIKVRQRKIAGGEEGVEVTEQEMEIKLSSKLGALELAMKHKGLFAATNVNNQHLVTVVNWDDMYEKQKQQTERLRNPPAIEHKLNNP
jgi:phage terminase small subunit